MIETSEIPFPVVFNPVKHHRNYILQLIREHSPDILAGLLEPLCNNYVDIYTGEFTPVMVAEGVKRLLESAGVSAHPDFAEWVSTPGGYRILTLPDGSEWVVRSGEDPRRYVHIHPSRTGLFTQRFKGSTLKTVYLLGCRVKDHHGAPTLEQVNQVRLSAGLSPVKNLERSRGILNCFSHFFPGSSK